tara:strand:+ start:4285 stop:5412 length:1128 start_codon:yes stop_codon:yes gene_type:complete
MRPLKILRILPLGYLNLVEAYIKSIPNFKELSYQEQKISLIKYAPAHVNSFSECMRNLGHECDEILFDLECNRKKWASENKASFNDHSWKFDTMMEQIIAYKPDVIYMQGHNFFPYWIRIRLKEIVPSLKKIVIYTGFPGKSSDFKDIDHIFCCIPSIQKGFQDAGCQSSLVYYYFDQNVHNNINLTHLEQDIDCSFLGTSGYGGHWQAHISRYQLLDELAKHSNIQMWLNEGSKFIVPEVEDYRPLREKYPNLTHSPRTGLDMYKILGESKVTINRHTNAANGDVGNMRMFEATGMGTCLLNDKGNNLSDIFEDDKEIVTYSSSDECIEKLTYLHNNPKVAKVIACAGQKRTLSEHSLQKRCEQLSHTIQSLFN